MKQMDCYKFYYLLKFNFKQTKSKIYDQANNLAIIYAGDNEFSAKTI